jgi:adenylate cyclase
LSIISESPINSVKLLVNFILIAALTGLGLDYAFDTRIDYWIHDQAVVKQARSQWKYAAVVVMDEKTPEDVSRIQALPLFALASDRLVAAGAKGLFLDARVSKEQEGRMPYASCIESNGDVRWSMPQCEAPAANQCQVLSSTAGDAPLKLQEQTMARFHIAPFPPGQKNLPDFLLFGFDALPFMSEQGIEASDRLLTRHDPIARWIDLYSGHAVLRLAATVDPERLQHSLNDTAQNEACDKDQPCRRIRLSKPLYSVQLNDKQAFLPLSRLASCDPDIGMKTAALAAGKAVIFQVTTPTESTDTVITAMTTATFGPKLLTPGAQYLADGIESLLNGDYPRRPGAIINGVLIISVAVFSVLAGGFLKQSLLWLFGGLIFAMLVALCVFNPLVQLWPVTATMLTFVVSVLQTTTVRLLIGSKHGELLKKYLTEKAIKELSKLKAKDSFKNSCKQVVVLISDVEGYSMISGILKEPENLLSLMNDYLNETSRILDEKYNGWLEAYVGDMVCYHWPFDEQEQAETYQNTLNAALELSQLQQNFFASVPSRYAGKFEPDVLAEIGKTIDAGISLTSGRVVMGDLGPEKGVKKFGILGDPLNLASRVESLTRLFNTEIIITGEIAETAQQLNLPIRRLGLICVKGQNKASMLYALGHADDQRFTTQVILAWEQWLTDIEQFQASSRSCPEIFELDRNTIEGWLKRGLLTDTKEWTLHEK